jgi:glycerol-3-phosphate dehydrogenase (NAD(P)+)
MKNKIAILGAGAFGTAFANALLDNINNDVTLISRNKKVVESINENNINKDYFPDIKLNSRLKCTESIEECEFHVLFIAIPTRILIETIKKHDKSVFKDKLIVNLSKGLTKEGNTITTELKFFLDTSNFLTLKGPSFAKDLISRNPTLLTLGYSDFKHTRFIREILNKTVIKFDVTNDIEGVEILSAIKNIYAIYFGIVKIQVSNQNTKYFLMTKAFNEMKQILLHRSQNPNSLFLAAGIGDFCLTVLSEESRNFQLGQKIGTGLNKEDLSNFTYVEGVNTLNNIVLMFPSDQLSNFPILASLKNFFDSNFLNPFKIDLNNILLNIENKTILTYGTFDLFHFGHFEILKRARSFGNKLIVGLSTDDFNRLKGKEVVFSYRKRKEYLESLNYVDYVFPEENWDQKQNDIIAMNVDMLIMGDDWTGKFDFLNKYCQVKYLPRTPGISTTDLKGLGIKKFSY